MGMQCRVCRGNELTRFLDLGFTPPADDFLTVARLSEPEVSYPLEVVICAVCKLVQLNFTVQPELLFQNEYPYESSTTETGRKHYASLAADVCQRFELGSHDLAVDIGSNVGVLLAGFAAQGVNVLGIEPASNVCAVANRQGIETINEFFGEALARRLADAGRRASVVTGTNVVAHIDDLHGLVKGLDSLLREKGVFVFEAPYLLRLLEHLEYDTIYHEHLSYLSIAPVKHLFGLFGMEVIDVREISIHGGSLRYTIARKGDYTVSSNVGDYLDLEDRERIHDLERLDAFARDVARHRAELVWLLQSLKRDGKSVVAVSAPAKGMTLLNYCGIGVNVLDFITEKADLKIGKVTPGTHVPVVPDSLLLSKQPDYALLLAWNFAEEIMKNLRAYRDQGGRFIIPIPEPRIVE
jgi:SAM-dependent methyltransferase